MRLFGCALLVLCLAASGLGFGDFGGLMSGAKKAVDTGSSVANTGFGMAPGLGGAGSLMNSAIGNGRNAFGTATSMGSSAMASAGSAMSSANSALSSITGGLSIANLLSSLMNNTFVLWCLNFFKTAMAYFR